MRLVCMADGVFTRIRRGSRRIYFQAEVEISGCGDDGKCSSVRKTGSSSAYRPNPMRVKGKVE